MKVINTILEYFLHTSTWKGLIAIATAAGVTIEPGLSDKIIAAGLALVGLIQVLVDDNKETKVIGSE